MISKKTLQFLSDLQLNNEKPWFDTNRPRYEAAKAEVEEFAAEMIKLISVFHPAMDTLQPKNCTFRINRDVRFSKNKRPYKNNMALYFNEGGKKADGAGYYFHIEPGNSFAAAGIWNPEREQLAKIRQEIDYNFKEFKKVVSARTFKKYFKDGLGREDILVRPPKGYDEENPAIDFLKLKSFVARQSFTNKEITEKDFSKNLASVFKAVQPLTKFLNRGLEG